MSDKTDKPRFTIVPAAEPPEPKGAATGNPVHEGVADAKQRTVHWIGVGRYTPQALLSVMLDKAKAGEFKHALVLTSDHDGMVDVTWSQIPNATLAFMFMQLQGELLSRFSGGTPEADKVPPTLDGA